MREDILQLTKKLVAIPSETHNREACLQILEVAQKELEGFAFTPFVKDGITSLLYTNTHTPVKQCKIILCAHLDVVTGSKEQFTPIEKDDRLYGRGAYDMKAATATMIVLFKELASQLPYTIGLQLTTDEEIVGFKGVGYQLREGVSAEFAITGECSSDMRIINQLKGLYVIQLKATGVAAHAAYPWTGENALLKLYDAIAQILKHYPIPTESSWTTTVNLAHIQTTNTSHNKVPHDATAELDVRFVRADKESVLEKIQSCLPTGVTMEVIKRMPSHDTPETNPFIQQLIAASTEITNEPLVIGQSSGGSDLIFFSATGIEGVEFGPKGGGHHSANEWVDLKSVEEYYKVLKNFLLSVK